MSYAPAIPGASNPPGPYGALPGLTPPSIGTHGGGVAQQSVIRTLFDYNPFAVLRDVYERHVPVSDFRLLLGAMGMKRGVDAPTTGHYERDWNRGLVKFAAIITPSAGAGTNVVLSLDAASMFNANATIGGAARHSSEIKVGDHLLGPTGKMARVVSKNEGVNPHQVTLRPVKAAVDLVGEFIATGEYAIVGNSWAEGTGLPLGSMSRVTKYTNSFQIIKQGGGGTGTEASNRLFVNFAQSGDSVIAEMNERSWKLYEEDFSHVLLLGQTIDNVTDTVNMSGLDAPVLGTEGLIPWITDNGHTHVVNSGAYTLTDFDNVGRTLWSERAGAAQAMTLDGYDIFVATENLLFSESGDDLTQMLMQNMASKFEGVGQDDIQPFLSSDFGLYVGFKAVRKGGMTFMFKLLHEFSAAKGLGSAGYDYQFTRLVLPYGQTRDAKSGKFGFSWGYEYKAVDGYSREVQYDTFGGVGTRGAFGVNTIVNQYDSMQWGIVSEIAGHFACPNKVVMQIPQ